MKIVHKCVTPSQNIKPKNTPQKSTKTDTTAQQNKPFNIGGVDILVGSTGGLLGDEAADELDEEFISPPRGDNTLLAAAILAAILDLTPEAEVPFHVFPRRSSGFVTSRASLLDRVRDECARASVIMTRGL